MFFTLAGVILAVLSLPFIVIAGDRNAMRRLPKPAFIRSLSESTVGRLREKSESEGSSGRAVTSPRPNELRRVATDSTVRGDMDRIGRVETGFSVSSGETYVRGMTLEKIGLD
ncbi:hypothetical protein BDD12DRAFT_277657 [Trichophaea hybrida]|nr:hypothetical protein BDD12DRAFT_277657 [Trichophaea hybrida]